MKKLLLIVAIMLGGLIVKAQHTLQFNQALLVSSAQTTVPVGKVWKVVSFLPNSNTIVNSVAYYQTPPAGVFSISVNSTPVYVSKVLSSFGASSGGNYSYTSVSGDGLLPMWLPAGTTLAAGTNIQYVSVIEFIVN